MAEADDTAGNHESDREITITRVYDAPAGFLFEAWSKPEHVMKWFGPKGWPLTLCEMDFRPGGSFRFAMTGASGKQNTPFGGTYHTIEAGRRIVYDNGFETPGAERMLITVTFEEVAGRTTLTIHTLFSSAEMRELHAAAGFEQGFGSALDQLGEAVAAMGRL